MSQDSTGPSKQFVINLCSLPAPITIAQPRAPRLTRFSFFLNRHREGERQEYHLMMGYFTTIAEANKWLATLSRVYPKAFVSEAPEAQPDLLSTTRRLRIVEIGDVSGPADNTLDPSQRRTRII